MNISARNWRLRLALLACTAGIAPGSALAQQEQAQQDQAATIAAMQRQIEELRAQVDLLTRALAPQVRQAQAQAPVQAPVQAGTPVTPAAPATPVLATAPTPAAEPTPQLAAASDGKWYDRLRLRGYTQLRMNELLSGDGDAPAGIARLRSPHDSGVGDDGNFAFRRVRLVFQGDVSDRLSLYLQSDFAASVNNQSNGEIRGNFVQLRDAYADLHLANRTVKIRFGQSKVPYGWENLQSSSNRLPLDRADAANSAVPGERDLGIVAYYTPPQVQAIWDDLDADGQKLFGNYGAFGLGLYNGQGINRDEPNNALMKVALATWPFRLDGLGEMFAGQVLELGVQGLLNKVQPEVRTGGISPILFDEKRVNLHAVFYPNPIGFQAEWNWGHGPAWDRDLGAITEQNLRGGYVQTMFRVKDSAIGQLMPYARYQHYRGGWKSSTNAPYLQTDEYELGVEWQPLDELELVVAYARMNRAEADERRSGRAQGDLIRTQLQWNY